MTKMIKFKELLLEGQKLPEYFYHVTPEENLNDVKAHGLDPGESESSSNGVYLSDDEFTSANYANMRPEVDHVLLKIDTSYLNPKNLGPDDYELEDFLDRNDWEIGGRRYDSVYDVSWGESLEYVNQVVYYDEIPPEAIEVIDSKFLN